MATNPIADGNGRRGVAALVVVMIFTAGMVQSAERTVLGEFITADW